MIRNYPGVEYVITANGGAVYSVREGKRVYQCLLEKESVEAAIAVRKRENMVLEVVIDGVLMQKRHMLKIRYNIWRQSMVRNTLKLPESQ